MAHADRPSSPRRQFRDAADRTSLAATTPDRFLTRAQVETRTGLSRSTLYRLMPIGQFPRPYRVGRRAVRWSQREVDGWAATRPRSYGARKQCELVHGDVQDADQNNPADDP